VVPVGETGLRDQCRSLKIKNLQTPAKQRMKAFMSQGKTVPWAGLILLFDGEVGRK
jgi:hypothetical protein